MSGPNSTSGNIPYTTNQPVTSTPSEQPSESGVNPLDGRRYTQESETAPAAVSIHMRNPAVQRDVLPKVNREKTVDKLQSAYKAHYAQTEIKRDQLQLSHSLNEIRHYLDNPALAKECTSYSIMWIPDEGEPISVIPPGTELNDRTRATEIRGMLHSQLDKLDQKFTASKLQQLEEEIGQQENLMKVAARQLEDFGAPLPVLPSRERVVLLGGTSTKGTARTSQPASPAASPERGQPLSPANRATPPPVSEEATTPSSKFELLPKKPDATPLPGRFELRLKKPATTPQTRPPEPVVNEQDEDNSWANFDDMPSSTGRRFNDGEPEDLLLNDIFEPPQTIGQPHTEPMREEVSPDIAISRPKPSKPVPSTIGQLPTKPLTPATVNGHPSGNTLTEPESEILKPTIVTPPQESLPPPLEPVSALAMQLSQCPASVGATIDVNMSALARKAIGVTHPKTDFEQKTNTNPLYMGPLHSARKAMLARAITNFHRKHSQDAVAETRDAMNIPDSVLPAIELGVLSTKPTPHTVTNKNGRLGQWRDPFDHLVQNQVPDAIASAIARATTGYQSDPGVNLLDSIMKDVEIIESSRASAGFDISKLETYRLYPDKDTHEELGQLCREYYGMLLKQGDLPPPTVGKGKTPVTTFTLSDAGKPIGSVLSRDLNPGVREHLEKNKDFYGLQIDQLKKVASAPEADALSSFGQTSDGTALKTFGQLYTFSQSSH